MTVNYYGDCSVDYCAKRAMNKGLMLCTNHLARYKRGSPGWNQKSQYEKSERERFWEKVDKDGPWHPEMGQCWNWTATTQKASNGEYGSFKSNEMGGSITRAHRVSFFYANGLRSDIANHIDHLCRNTLCVNPDHLELVSSTENILRGLGPTAVNARKTHCISGHEFTFENTYHEPAWPERRNCRACHKRAALEWAQKRAKGGRKNKYSDDQIVEAKSLRNSGMRIKMIADTTGISLAYVNSIVYGGSKRANEIFAQY